MTLEKWVSEWLTKYKRVMVKPSTYNSYRDCLVYVTSQCELAELTNMDVQEMISDMAAEGLSLSTIKHMLTLVRQSLRKAKKLGMVQNLAMLEELELPRAGKVRVMPLSSAEVKRLLDCRYMSYYGDFFTVLLLTGMRCGELIALRWQDVNMFTGEIRIRFTDYRGKLQRVKTYSGERTIPLYGELFKIFRSLYRSRIGERVFINTLGRPVCYRTLLDAWKRFCLNANITSCGIHKLRHTFAHRALRSGVPVKVVSAWLGHADIQITLQIYDAVDGDDFRNAAELLDGFLGARAQKNNALAGVVGDTYP